MDKKEKYMNDKDVLINNINKLHTTVLGESRIKNNLDIKNKNIVNYCKKIILDNKCSVSKNGKNYYVKNQNIVITINANSYTIITAHLQ